MSHTTRVSHVSGVPARLADQGIPGSDCRRRPGRSPPYRSVSLANPLADRCPSLRVPTLHTPPRLTISLHADRHRGPSPYHLGARRSIEIIYAGQVAFFGQIWSVSCAKVATLCCRTCWRIGLQAGSCAKVSLTAGAIYPGVTSCVHSPIISHIHPLMET